MLVYISDFLPVNFNGVTSVIVAASAWLHIHLGIAHLGVGTISRAKHRELWVSRVAVGKHPAETLQRGVVEQIHKVTLAVGNICQRRVVNHNLSLSRTRSRCFREHVVGRGVCVCSHIAGTVAAAEDIMILLER